MDINEDELIKQIDNFTYEDLLFKWRFAPSGNPFFKGAVGKYYMQAMSDKREKLEPGELVRISKKLGW